jgi:hypothetical protein
MEMGWWSRSEHRWPWQCPALCDGATIVPVSIGKDPLGKDPVSTDPESMARSASRTL